MLRFVRSVIVVVAFSSLLYGQDSSTVLRGLHSLIAKGLDPRMSRVFFPPLSFDRQQPAVRLPAREVISSREVQLKSGKALVTSNIPLHPNPITSQSEISIAVHPFNPEVVFVGANTLHINGMLRSQGWYISNTGGDYWSGGDTIPTHTNFNLFMADPSVAIGTDSTLFYNSIRYNGTDTGDVVVAKSTDKGETWGDAVVPNVSINVDKNFFTIDNIPASPFRNYLYSAFTDFLDEEFTSPVKFSRSTDYGESFSSPVVISDYIGLIFAQGVNLSVGPNGELYAAWSGYDNWPPPVQSRLGFNASTDGGATWQGARTVRTVSDVRGMLRKGNDSIRVNSFPSIAVDRSPGPRSGWIYIVYAERSPQRPDVYLIRSSDGGWSWSAPQRIVNLSGDRWLPWMTVDQLTGALYVVYYDSRNFPANDSAEVYLSASFDGGVTFQDIKMSDAAFLPKPIAGAAQGYMGDYIGVSALNNTVWCAWNDDRDGIHQAYAAKVTFELYLQPIISVAPNTLDFGSVILNTTKRLSLAISNSGIAETLWISSVESDNNNFIPSRTTMTIPAQTTSQLDIEFRAEELGEIEALLTIESNDPERPTVVVPMRATVALPPTIRVAPDSIVWNINEGDTGLAELTIVNRGISDLEYVVEKHYPPLQLKQKANGREVHILTVSSYYDSNPILDSLGLTYTIVYYHQFDTVSLSNYDLLYIDGTFWDYEILYNRKEDLARFVQNGGGLVVTVGGSYEYLIRSLPVSLRVINAWNNRIEIRSLEHPVMSNLTDERLSFWGDIYIGFIEFDDDLEVLAIGTDAGDFPVLLAGNYGLGRIIITCLSEYEEGYRRADMFAFKKNCIHWAGKTGNDWLITKARSGIVSAQDSVAITLKSLTLDLDGGTYEANLQIRSNDPEDSLVNIPIHLEVNPGPNLITDTDTLEFDSTFVGYSDTMYLMIQNNGSELLTIHSMTTNANDFQLNASSLVLVPGDIHLIPVWFIPTDAREHWAQLYISSNDPSNPLTAITLHAKSVYPPRIHVVPDSLTYTMLNEDTLSSNLNIVNSGSGTLSFSASVNYGTEETVHTYPRILLFQNHWGLQVLLDALYLDYTVVNTEDFDTVQLSNYDVLILDGIYEWDYYYFDQILNRKEDITAFLEQGGGVIATFERISNAWQWIPDTVIGAAERGSFVQVSPQKHFITDSLTDNLLSEWVPSFYNTFKKYSIFYSVLATAPFYNNSPTLLARDYGEGRLILSGMNVQIFSIVSYQGALLLFSKMIRWAAKETWLSIAPTSGSISGDGSMSLEVTAKEVDLIGGDYDAVVTIRSNDPLDSMVAIPIHLNLLGSPKFTTTVDTINFGRLYIGVSDTSSLFIWNKGSDTLTISNHSIDNSAFVALDVLPIIISPRRTFSLRIMYQPPDSGEHRGVLTLVHNDSSASPAEISVLGNAVYPPRITVEPDSIFVQLNIPDTTTISFALINTGADTLKYEITDTVITWPTKATFNKLVPDGIAQQVLSPVLPVIITDSTGDQTPPSLDIKSIHAFVDSTMLFLQVHTVERYDRQRLYGWISLDVDQNIHTGDYPPSWGHGRYSQDVGSDFEVVVNALGEPVLNVYLYDNIRDEYVQSLNTTLDLTYFTIRVPLSSLNYDDGNMNMSAVFIDRRNFTFDWAPDTGHGVIANRWMTFSPQNGMIASADTQRINLHIETNGLLGNIFKTDLLIANNDPLEPLVVVPVVLHTIGAPRISGSRQINFGDIFIGYSKLMTLRITNSGTDTLFVRSIQIDSSAFQYLGDTLFILPVRVSKDLDIQFTPNREGDIMGRLTIYNNMPANDSAFSIQLYGRGLYPPVMRVAPDSFSFALSETDSAQSELHIANDGGSNLNVNISHRYIPVWRGQPIDSSVKVLLVSDFETEETAVRNVWQQLSVVSFEEIDTVTFQKYDVVIVGEVEYDEYLQHLIDKKEEIASFVRDGGAIIAFAERSDLAWHWLPDTVRGIWHDPSTCTPVSFADISHPLIDSLTDNDIGRWQCNVNYALRSVPSDYVVVFKSDWGWPVGNLPVMIAGYHGRGRVIATVLNFWSGFPKRLLTNMLYWSMYGGSGWMQDITQGVRVLPGDSLAVNVKTLPKQQTEGSYRNDIILNSNDPATPQVVVPVLLNVSGTPKLSVAFDTLSFGEAFIGYNDTNDVWIRNSGKDTLLVYSAQSTNKDFTSLLSETLKVPPWRSRSLSVQFHPTTEGVINGTLLIESNDTSDLSGVVHLQGIGVEPPIIEVTPDSISTTILEGDSTISKFTIANQGRGVLQASVFSTSALPDTSMKILLIEDWPFVSYLLDSLGFHYVSMGSSAYDTVEIDKYDLIVFGYHIWNSLGNRKSDLDTYLEKGRGIVILGGYELGTWTWVPFNVAGQGRWYYRVRKNNVFHPVLDSLPQLREGEYYQSSYAYDTLPNNFVKLATIGRPSASIIAAGKHKRGRVVLSGLWIYESHHPAGKMLANMVRWAGSRTDVSVDTVALQPSFRQTYDVHFLQRVLNPNTTYHGNLVIISNDPATQRVNVPVTVRVIAGANLVLLNDTLDFGETFIGYPETLSVQIQNLGSQVLQVDNIACSNPRYTVLETFPVVLTPKTSVDVRIRFSATELGRQTGIFAIASNDLLEPVTTMFVTSNTVPTPYLTITSDSLVFQLSGDDSAAARIQIRNDGQGVLRFRVEVNSRPFTLKKSDENLQKIPLRVEDNSDAFDTLWFGAHPDATYGIDTFLDEYELPPVPPTGSFDARLLDIPSRYPEKGNGVKTDIRRFVRFTQVDTFLVRFQASSGGYPLKLSWSPDVRSYARAMQLVDRFGGVIVNVNMFDTSEVSISNYELNQLFIFKSGAINLSFRWLKISPDSGTVESDSTLNLLLTVRSRGLIDSTYFGRVIISSNDPLHPTVSLPVRVDVVSGTEGSAVEIPKEFALYQNFPNPFNPITELRFDIPSISIVTIKIYNVLGQEITSLVDGPMTPGRYGFKWKAAQYPTGVYFYRFTVVNSDGKVLFTEAKKLLLVK
jgi:hypothetical protein